MKKCAVILAMLMGLAMSANADVIVGFDVSTCTSAASVWSAVSVISGLDTTTPAYNTLSRTGLGTATAGSAYGGNNWNITSTFGMTSEYISFSITPITGYSLTLSTLAYVVNGSASAPINGRWGYSTDGGSSFTYQTDWSITSSSASSLMSGTWDFGDFSTTGAVDFRFWAYGTQGINSATAATSGSVYIRNITGNDLVLNGTIVAVPEPASIGLLLLGLTGIRMFARRRQG